MSPRRRQLQNVLRELCGVLLLVCASVLPALVSEPSGDPSGRVERTVAHGERDAALIASTSARPAPAHLARVRAATLLPALLVSEQHSTPRWARLAADGGEKIRRPAPCLRSDRYRPRSDCGDDVLAPRA